MICPANMLRIQWVSKYRSSSVFKLKVCLVSNVLIVPGMASIQKPQKNLNLNSRTNMASEMSILWITFETKTSPWKKIQTLVLAKFQSTWYSDPKCAPIYFLVVSIRFYLFTLNILMTAAWNPETSKSWTNHVGLSIPRNSGP